MKKIITLIFLLYINYAFAQAPTAGLVAYWPLDGNFNDASGNGINGTNIAATATANKNGLANKAMDFANPSSTAVAQSATHPITAALNFTALQDFTLTFWVYLNSTISHNVGVYDNNLNAGGYGVFIFNSPLQMRFSWKQGQISATSSAIPLATWKHVTCVKNGTTLSIYINGVLNVSGVGGASTPSYPLPGRFGALTYTASPPLYNGLEGKIDELRIYNRALSAAEINAVVLPIKLSSFSGSLNNNKTVLNWQTEFEQNAKDFVVQRSIDNTTFENVGKVNANGNSDTISKYNFVDDVSSITASKIYYRLQSNDIDGKQTYSDIITLKKANTKTEISVYPNPVNNKIQVQAYFIKEADALVKIITSDGKIALQKTIKIQAGNNSFPIDLSNMEKGNYFLQIETLEEKYVKEIVKL
jgi:Concanavalin A-like lectin/glucanases superfamily/Secretion system C-terminal sorting domain